MKKISRLHKIKDGKRVYYSPGSEEKNLYGKIKEEIERKYAVTPANRDLIIKQLISTLTHGDYNTYKVADIDLFIIRSDIKNFYPSINKHQLYKKLMKANMLSNTALTTLKSMVFSKSIQGIPMGLSFSSVLAEIYLEKFDEDIYRVFNPTFYFRYVDDLIIINYDTLKGIDKEESKEALENVFISNYLEMNEGKTSYSKYSPQSDLNSKLEFNYLGYDFRVKKKGKYSSLLISINEKKYKKIMDRIKKYFYLFKKGKQTEKQFWLLYYRLKNSLFGVTSYDREGKKMNFGLGYSYRFVNDEKQVEGLLLSVKGLIYSCKMTSKRRSALLSLLNFENEPLNFLKKRYDYTRLTTDQLKKFEVRLGINKEDTSISNIFYCIYKGI